MVEFSSWVLRVFMMTVNKKSKRNDRGRCLGWRVTNYGPGYGVSSLHRIIFCRNEGNYFLFSSASKVKTVYLMAMMLIFFVVILTFFVMFWYKARFLGS